MVYTAVDGDKVFVKYQGKGNLGKDAKGTYNYVGGTGKYTGIEGSGELSRLHLQPPPKECGRPYPNLRVGEEEITCKQAVKGF